MVLTPGTSIGEFEVLSPLGAGGMGEVYRARDPRLEREVALKVLPAETVADDTSRARLLREARMASKLNHPNICTIYEVGETEQQTFIAMELVSGEALSDRLSGGRMGVEDVLRLGHQMADALAHAHDNGVVHRDFKSGNVVITPEGRAKVLDFGLAARVSDTELTEATTYSVDSLELSGKIVGTLAYMAPEQLRGEAADARSDIWALGIVLYEMASGVRPFQGKTGFELSSAILSATPEPLPPGSGGQLPSQLQMVVDRCLEKEPERRYQSAGEVRAALETAQSAPTGISRSVVLPPMPGHRWLLAAAGLAVGLAVLAALDVGGVRRLLTGSGASDLRAVRMAVLPFANLSGDPEQEYLADGFTQEMITQLGKLHPEGLSVIARSSVMRYKNGETPIDQIGRDLNVEYVLEGGAQREAGRVRIAVNLINVEDQMQLWADSYERELSGILSVQSEVAREVAGALALELLPDEQARLASVRTVDPEAYEAYLQGSYHWKKLTPESLDTAQRYLELALEKDANYAPAYFGISLVWLARATATAAVALPHEAAPKARAAANRSLELDSTLAEPHFALAGIAGWYEWDWDTAEREFRLALDLNPNFADGHVFYGLFLTAMGRLKEARAHIQNGLDLDPHNFMYRTYLGIAFERSRRFDEAIVHYQKALAMEPTFRDALGALRNSYHQKGMYEESLEVAKRLYVARGEHDVAEALERGRSHGGYQEAMRQAAEALMARSNPGNAMRVAALFTYAGDTERALDWLETAYRERLQNMIYLGVYPKWDPLRSDPRFQDLLRRMNLPLSTGESG